MTSTIIDFTLSRMESDVSGQTHYIPLSDEAYFNGEGDYQFDIYRMMRDEIKEDWKSYQPKTNVMVSWPYHYFIGMSNSRNLQGFYLNLILLKQWLHYLTEKLIHGKIAPTPRSKVDKEHLAELKAFSGRILKNPNAMRLMADPYIRSKIEFSSK